MEIHRFIDFEEIGGNMPYAALAWGMDPDRLFTLVVYIIGVYIRGFSI